MENQHESQSGSDINVQSTTSESSKRNTKAKASAPANNNTATTPTKRNKSMRACDECRKRKVKCDGVQPCSKCRKSEIECVFAKLPPKRGPPKQYIELLEARLQLVEKALQSIDGPARRILDNALLGSVSGNNENIVKPENEISTTASSSPMPTITTTTASYTSSNNTFDQFGINEIGQAMYVNDVPERIDRIPNLYGESAQFISHHKDSTIMGQCADGRDNAMETDIKQESATTSLLPPEVSQSLIETYFAHVHKFVPMIHNPMFYKQIGMATDNIEPPSPLLLFAMCAVASRWTNECNNNSSSSNNNVSSSSSLSSPPPNSSNVPGFGYYQRAFAKVEEYSDAPRLSTIQGLVLLTKYQEYYKRLGFFRRPGLYLGIAAKMCNDLGLPQMESTPRPGQDPQEHEAKKRTFWTVFMYDLMMSIEQAREPYFSNADCTTEYPSVTSEEGPWLEEVVISNTALIQLSRTLSEIYATIRRVTARQNAQGEKRSPVQVLEEQGKLFLLHTHLENFIHELPAALSYAPTTQIIAGVLPAYPAEKQAIGNVFAAFLHMTYHFSMILLHRHYLLHPLPVGTINNNDMMEPYQHQQLCAWSASNITAIAETLLETQPIDVFSYPTRGVQHTIHCLTSAATIHHYEMANPDKMIAQVAQQQYSRTLSVLNRLAAESPAIELQAHIKEQDAELAQLYGRMVVDPARAVSSSSDSNTTPVTMAAPATPMPQQDPLALSSDTSSASSSPVMKSSPARGIRRHTLTGPGSHLMQMAMNNTPPQQQQQQQQQQTMPYMLDGGGASSLFSSSAAFSDPSRFASLMMRGGTTNMPIYNHHQQPLPVQQQQTQHFSNPQAYLQRKSRLRHPMSYSQEDLRSLRRAHMNKPLGGGSSNWPPAHARGSPIPPDFVYDSSSSVMESGNPHQQQQPRLARSLRRQSSMTAMMPSYYAQRQQQLPLRRQPSHHPSTALSHQQYSPHQQSLQQQQSHHHHPSPPPRMPTVATTTTTTSFNHPRRHTISIPSEPSASSIVPAYMNHPTPPSSSLDQQPSIDPFISDTMMNLDTISTPSDYAYSPAVSTPMDTTTPVSTPAGMMVMDPSSANNDTIMNDFMLQMGAAAGQWPISDGFDHTTTSTSTTPGAFVEDIQRSEGHVI